jgi:hypothetical protein
MKSERGQLVPCVIFVILGHKPPTNNRRDNWFLVVLNVGFRPGVGPDLASTGGEYGYIAFVVAVTSLHHFAIYLEFFTPAEQFEKVFFGCDLPLTLSRLTYAIYLFISQYEEFKCKNRQIHVLY